MFYVLMCMLFICFVLTVIRQKKYQNQPAKQRVLAVLTYVLLTIVLLITIFA